jgi:hypothetical protein
VLYEPGARQQMLLNFPSKVVKFWHLQRPRNRKTHYGSALPTNRLNPSKAQGNVGRPKDVAAPFVALLKRRILLLWAVSASALTWSHAPYMLSRVSPGRGSPTTLTSSPSLTRPQGGVTLGREQGEPGADFTPLGIGVQLPRCCLD